MEIQEIAIDHYGPLRDVRHRPRPGLQVFYGPNESGKTLLIDAMLKLLLGRRLKDFQNIDRVDDMPQGRVAMFWRGKEHIFDGRTLLEDVTGISASDLRNIFVIRNKDLQFSDQREYFSRLNDQLTGMEGRRLARLKESVRILGRMTRASSAAQLSKSQDFDGVGDKVKEAEKLAAEIREYVEQARKQQLDALENKLEASRRQLKTAEEQIQLQEQAKTWDEFQQKCRLVEEYSLRRQAAQELQSYTQAKFVALQEKETQSRENRKRASENNDKLQQLLPELKGQEAELAELQARLAPQEARTPLLDKLIQRSIAVAENPPPAPATLWPIALVFLLIAALALYFAGEGSLPQSLAVLPYLSIAAALLFLGLDLGLRLRNNSFRKKHARLVQEGAEVGIMATTIQELAAAAAQEKAGIEKARALLQKRGEKIRDLRRQKAHLEEEIRAASLQAAALEQEVSSQLQLLAVSDLQQFGQRMQEYNKAEAALEELGKSLQEAFGQTPGESGDWQSLLEQILPPSDPGIRYSASAFTRLREERNRLTEEIEQLREGLQAHQAELNRFAAACLSLPLEKETGTKLPGQFADIDMLDWGASVLEDFVAKVRGNFETARQLMIILEELEAQEQEKIADLVGADKPVQEIFRTITAGKYTRVLLDPQLNLQVETCQGLELPASALSQGTFDQLYLALRLSLAQEVLAGSPGFLILDDAFLCADSARLEKMLALLARLAGEGWQVLYFSMDERLLQAAPAYTDNAIISLAPLVAGPR
jgi:hypothetical protein